MSERKDVYASMAPATYTRTLGSGVGRSPTTIVGRKRPVALTTAVRRIRRRPRDGSKALTDGRARLETKLDPEVLEIFHGARAETKLRHVRTPAGVSRYHAPIGTPIIGGHAVPSLPSAGGGRMRAGGNAKRPTSGLIRGGGSSGRGGSSSRGGGFTGGSSRGRNGFTGRSGGRRGGMRNHNMPGGGGGGGGLGGLLGGAGLGKLFGGGKKPPAGTTPKQKKPKKPPKGKQPPKPKKARVGRSTKPKGSTTTPKTSTTPKPTKAQLAQAAQRLLLIPPQRLGGVLHTLPYNVLGDLLRTIQDPNFAANAASAVPAGSKALADGAGWLETKEPRAASGDERCMACGVDLDDTYDVIADGKSFEMVVCVPCASENKAGSGDSGIPGHLPEQLRRYWTGKGKARWAENPHPYTALVDALTSEGVPAKVVHGLAANLFRDVFGIFPAQRSRALGGSTHGYAKSGAQALLEAKSRLLT